MFRSGLFKAQNQFKREFVLELVDGRMWVTQSCNTLWCYIHINPFSVYEMQWIVVKYLLQKETYSSQNKNLWQGMRFLESMPLRMENI